MNEVRLGLISCGNMGRSLITSTTDIPGCAVSCVADVVEEKARALAEELGCAYVTNAELLMTRDDVDAVVIAAPNFLHRDLAVKAAAHGNHIFCEKPMALTKADAQAMVQAAADHGVKLMVGQVLRYIAPFPYVKRLVDGGELGEPFGMQTTRIGGGWGGHYHAAWRLKRETCGGPLYEVSSHEIDYMRQIMGEAKAVTAHLGHYVVPDIDYEDLAMLLIDFGKGSGQLLAGHSAFLGAYDVKLFCTKGTVLCRPWPTELRYKTETGEEVLVDSAELETEPGVRREMREFVECILNDTPPTIPGEEGVRNVEIAEAARISSEEGRKVPLPL
jgi:predicted dehydrogenase